MTTFNDKEKAAENKFAHDKELEFKAHARAHKLLGLWAAGKMGFSGAAAEDYANSLAADTDLLKSGLLFDKIKGDLLAKNVLISDHDIRAELHRLEMLARQQINGQQ